VVCAYLIPTSIAKPNCGGNVQKAIAGNQPRLALKLEKVGARIVRATNLWG